MQFAAFRQVKFEFLALLCFRLQYLNQHIVVNFEISEFCEKGWVKLCEKSLVNVMILHNKYLLERCDRFYTPSARKPWLTVNRVQARCSRDPLLLRQFGGDMESEKTGEILDVLQFSDGISQKVWVKVVSESS